MKRPTSGQLCSFWLITALAMNGRGEEARDLFDRLLPLSNDLGLFSEGTTRSTAA
jgi:GH15 family glucan-1,4-alpha-glucosidase